ncbi:hypothetical protein PybrP1_006073 [[Pythium] brassicae (nom. inval.)]|nr:hypothetical protein PybrP1_006073 [[Pythium] brassicae (nom. inval.)]
MRHYRRRLPLASAVAVCSSRAGLEPLAHEISSFLDPRTHRWTLECACEHGFVQLLRQLVLDATATAPPLLRVHEFRRAIVAAVRVAADTSERDGVELLECLRAYCPTGCATAALSEAVARGSARVAQWLVTNFPTVERSPELVATAASGGHLEVLQWLWRSSQYDEQIFVGALKLAAGRGHLGSVTWLLESGAVCLPCLDRDQHDALWNAVGGGHLHVFAYLHDARGFTFGDYGEFMLPIDQAARAGSLALVSQLYERGYTHCSKSALFAAVKSGGTELVRWLLAHAPAALVNDELCLLAADCGDLALVQLLYAVHPTPFNVGAMVSAAGRGQLALLEWLFPIVRASTSQRSDGFGYTVAIYLASLNGHVAVVQWLYRTLRDFASAPRYYEHHAVSNAAGSGHEELARWLHAQWGAEPRPPYDLALVAASGRLRLVQWLAESSCVAPVLFAYDVVAANGHLATLQYLYALDPSGVSAATVDAAAKHNRLDVVQWLVAHTGEEGQHALDQAAKHNHLRIVRWLHANTGLACSTDAMDAAASLEMVEWLHEHRSEGCTTAAMDRAAKRGDFDTVLFLYDNRREGCTARGVVDAYVHGFPEIAAWLCEAYPALLESEEVRNVLSSASAAARLREVMNQCSESFEAPSKRRAKRHRTE